MTEGPFKPPIFVVGTPRSGTTLTARMLGNHPHLFMPGETHFMHDIFARRAQLGDPQESAACEKILARLSSLYRRYNSRLDQERFDAIFSQPQMAQQLRAACTSYGALFQEFMELQARHQGRIRWGNNVPKDVFHVEEILGLFPDAKIIFCARDIRDFLLSYKGKWQITTSGHQDRLRDLYHPVLTSLLWKATMKRLPALQARVPARNFMICRYEDTVADPMQTARRLCTLIDEPFDERMLEVEFRNSSAKPQGAGIFSSSVGLWKRELSAEEVHIAQSVAKREMNALGYALEPVRANPLKVAAIRLATPLALVRAYQANRAQNGPLLQYVLRRAGALFGRR